MPKGSGLGDALYIDSYDLSGDVGSVGGISSPFGVLPLTGINKYAPERTAAALDGTIAFQSWFNPDVGHAHVKLSALPRTDVLGSYFHGGAVGNVAASCMAKQVGYDGNRGTDGSLTMATNLTANGYGLEWGLQATAGIASFTGTGSGTAMIIPGLTSLVQGSGSAAVASTPDTATLDIVGDIDLRVRVAAADWTPAAAQVLIAKWNTSGNQRSYALSLSTAGELVLEWSTSGAVGTVLTKTSTANLSTLAGGAIKWVRATLDVDNGASGNTVAFYTSDDNSTWTQLGASVVTGTATSIFSSTAVLELGARNSSGADFLAGKVFAAQVLTGIAGTVVANPVADGSTGFTDSTGKVWTNGTSAINSGDNRNGVVSYLHVFSFTGTDAFIGFNGSLDNGVADAYANTLAGLEHGITAVGGYRLEVAAGTVAEKYLKLYVAGTFTQISFAVNVVARGAALA
jgi:hypothetical protein